MTTEEIRQYDQAQLEADRFDAWATEQVEAELDAVAQGQPPIDAELRRILLHVVGANSMRLGFVIVDGDGIVNARDIRDYLSAQWALGEVFAE